MLPEGFKTIKLENHDNSETKRSVLDRTEKEYDRALMFVANHEGAVSPPDIRTYKGFMEFLGRNVKGRLSKGKTPVLSTLDGMRRDLDAGLARRRSYHVPEHVSTTIKEWMKKDLKQLLDIPDLQMSRDAFSRNDLKIVQKHLWCQDSYEYRGIYPERSRVELSASMLLYCFTSARTGEVYESTARRTLAREQGGAEAEKNLRAAVMAACYKHFRLSIEWVGGEIMLVLNYNRDYLKGFWRKEQSELPIHGFYERYTEEMPLILNLLTFFLPLASADKAFRDYDSTGEILDRVDLLAATLQEGDDKSVETIHFKPNILDIPIFRPRDEQNIANTTGRSRGADAFGKMFAALGQRAGYPDNITVRACRRSALMEADKSFSKTARMKFSGHVNPGTFGRSYTHRVVEVDGAASFLGIQSRRDHIENNRSMGARRNPQLYQSLPAKAELEFQDRDDVVQIDTEIQALKRQLMGLNNQDSKSVEQQRRHLEARRQRLYLDELARIRHDQPRRLELVSKHAPQTVFYYARKVMPERNLLAELLPQETELRSSTGRMALRALEAICSQMVSVCYLSSIAPVDGKCLCGEPVEKYHPHRRWLHLYRCYAKQLAAISADNFAELCVECDLWYNDLGKWTKHCEEHLISSHNLLRCDPIIFRNAPVKAGFCPFCLGEEIMSPRKRMTQYLDRSEWYKHVQSHLSPKALSGMFHCRHPACQENIQTLENLECHLRDVHFYNPPRGKKRKIHPTKEEQ
ncbi:hypothetical protein COH21_008703 [Aspergillus flavus]|nr:hypothetical protein COH21_008703 [Aspergillus flavus]